METDTMLDGQETTMTAEEAIAVTTTGSSTTPEASEADKKETGDDNSKKPEGDTHPPLSRKERRIETLTARNYEEKAKSAQLARENAVLVEKLAALEKAGNPKAEDFEDEHAYLNATAQHHARKEALTVAKETITEAAQQAVNDEGKRQWDKHLEREKEIVAEIPDYKEKVSTSTAPYTRDMQEAILASPVSAHIIYELANRPDESARITTLSPVNQIREIALLEGQINMRRESPAPNNFDKPTPVAKPTIRPAGTGAVPKGRFDPMKEPVDENWVEQRLKSMHGG